jgi:hypothetical protein
MYKPILVMEYTAHSILLQDHICLSSFIDASTYPGFHAVINRCCPEVPSCVHDAMPSASAVVCSQSNRLSSASRTSMRTPPRRLVVTWSDTATWEEKSEKEKENESWCTLERIRSNFKHSE